MKKKRRILAMVLACILCVMLLPGTAQASTRGTDLSNISFTVTDLRDGSSHVFNGGDGKKAVIVFGGIGTCSNTMSALTSLTKLAETQDMTDINLYAFDISGAAVSTMLDAVDSYGISSQIVVNSISAAADGSTLFQACISDAGISGSFTMPLIVYKEADGTISETTTGYSEYTTIAKTLFSDSIRVAEEVVSLSVQYGQTEAREMLALINEFRTGEDAWYWNSDDTTKTTVSLSELTYDYDLEKVAMLRAAEIAYSYSHTRPNGTSCFTAYSELGYGYQAAGENIAAGYTSAESVFEAWQESWENYSGQGHRRNMLSGSFTAVGIGHVYYNGRHYWVQEFANPVQNTTETAANDGSQNIGIEIIHYFLTVPAVAPTCTENGNIEYEVCLDCGLIVADNQVTEIPATGHDWVAGTPSQGVLVYTCRNCGEEKTENVDGLYEESAVWRYYEGGKWASKKYGYVSYNGGLFLVANGVVATDIEGLAQDPEHTEDWYFLAKGQAQTQYTGLAQYDGAWFYISDGKLDTKLAGYVAYDGGLFYVGAGKIMTAVSGLAQDPVNPDDWYYLANGQAQTQYTGLAAYDGEWFYVVKGKLAVNYTGAAEYDGEMFNIVNGMVR